MTNTISVNNILAKYVPAYFMNECQTLKVAARPVDSDFKETINGYNIGNACRIRLPNYINTRTGVVFQPSALTEREETIVLDRVIGADWDPSVLQLTTDMDSNMQIMERWIEPAIMKCANQIDQDVINGLMTSVYNVAGTASGTVGSWSTFDLAKTQMVKKGITAPYSGLLNPTDAHYLKSSMVNFFNTNFNEKIGVKGVLGETSGIMCYESQNLNVTHTNGTFAASGNVTVATTSVTGATTLALTGFTTSSNGVLNAGDIITVAGVYAVNIMNQLATGGSTIDLRTFVVQNTVNSDSSGNATVNISPTITFSTGNPYNNVTALPASTNVVSLYGGANAVSTQNFLMSKDGILFTMKTLFKPYVPNEQVSVVTDKKTGVSFNLTRFFDGNNYINALRMDGLYGFLIQPDYIVRLIG